MNQNEYRTEHTRDLQARPGMTAAGILRTVKGLHWFLLYIMVVFLLGFLGAVLQGWIGTAIWTAPERIGAAPQVTFYWLYFGTMGLGVCSEMIWLWLSREKSAVSWGWRIFVLLDILATPLTHYYLSGQTYADWFQAAMYPPVSVSENLIGYGYLMALIPLAYYSWAVWQSRGSRQAAGSAHPSARQPMEERSAQGQQATSGDIQWTVVDDQQAEGQHAASGDIYWAPADDGQAGKQQTKSKGLHWIPAFLLSLGGTYVLYKIIEWIYMQVMRAGFSQPSIAGALAAFFYCYVAAVLLGFLLWIRITAKRYVQSANWQIGSAVIFVEIVMYVYHIVASFGLYTANEAEPDILYLFISGELSFSAVHLFAALLLACLPLLYWRSTIRKAKAAAATDDAAGR